jgi:hypothetical protein
MKYAFGMDSVAMAYMPSSIKIGFNHSNVDNGVGIQRHTDSMEIA